jgi:hypothetical protein
MINLDEDEKYFFKFSITIYASMIGLNKINIHQNIIPFSVNGFFLKQFQIFEF